MTPLTLERRITLSRPLHEVYAYLADFSSIEQWDPGVFTAEKATPGAPRVGTRFVLSLNVFGKAQPMQYELVTLDAPLDGRATLVLTGQGEGFSAVDTLALTALDAQHTQLDYRAELQVAPMPRVLHPLLRAWGRRLGNLAMNGLIKAMDEDGPERLGASQRLAQRLVLPGMWNFTQRGYRQMHSRGLARRLDGRKVGITGITSGLGLAAAQLLARQGATLVVVGRDAERLAAACEAIHDFAGRRVDISIVEGELSLVADAHRVADRLIAEHPDLDVWINNAGALFDAHELTAEGHERALAINLITPALLARRLAPTLASRQGRIINVVSGGLYTQGLHLDDMNFANAPYNGAKAYARAKRGLLDLTRRWATDPALRGVRWHAMHPGWAATPGVAKSLPDFNRQLDGKLRNSRMGADTIVWLASHPALSDPSLSGSFWFDRAPRPDALLPGTASSTADVDRLLHWLDGVI